MNIVLSVLLLSALTFGQCKGGDLSGHWTPVVLPDGGRVWRDASGTGHGISRAAGKDYLVGERTLVALDGTEGCETATALMSFSDLPGTTTWLNVRLERDGVCAEGKIPYPDVAASGPCVGINKAGDSACVLLGPPTVFLNETPPQQPGGVYSAAMVVQCLSGACSVFGDPVLFPSRPDGQGDTIRSLPMDVRGQVRVTVEHDGDAVYLKGEAVYPNGMTAQVRQRIKPPDPHGAAGAETIHGPNRLCSPRNGPQEVNFPAFVVSAGVQ